MVDEIHRQERDLRCDVALAKSRVELDAVEDDEWIDAADMLGVQVAVSVADAAFALAAAQQGIVPTKKLTAEATDRFVVVGFDRVAVERIDFSEVIFKQLGDHRWVAAACDL